MLGKTGFCLPKGELTIEIICANFAHMTTYITPALEKVVLKDRYPRRRGGLFFTPKGG